MRRRAQMFVLTHLLSPLIAFGLAGLLYGGAGVASYPLLGLSLGFASFYIYPFLLRGVLSFRAASFLSTGQLTTLVLLTLYFFGGFSSFALPWIATIPILGMLYLGLRGAYSTTLIAAIGVSILFALHLLGHGFDDPIPVEWRNSVLMASIGLCILFNTGILFLHAGLYQIAQRASQERGARLSHAQAMANLGSWEFDFSTRRMVWSPEIYRMFGHEEFQFDGSPEQFLSFVHPDDRTLVLERAQDLARGTDYAVSFRIVRSDGEERDVSVQGEITRFADGKPSLAQGFIHDITERTRTESDLRKAEERFRGIFEQAAVGIGLMTPSGRFLMVNQKLCELMNRSEAELLKLRFAQFIDPGDLGVALQNFTKLTSGQVETCSQLIRYSPEAGKQMWGNLTVSLIREDDSDRFALLGIVEDITERRQAEERLKDRETRLQLITDNVPGALFFVDSDMHILFANSICEKWFALPREDLTGKRLEEFFAVNNFAAFSAQMMRALAGEQATYEGNLTYPDGVERDVVASCMPHFAAGGGVEGAYVFAQDVSQRKRAEEQLRQAQKMEAVGQLTGGVAHDFNNLLSIILGNLDLLDEKMAGGEALHKYLNNAIGAVERAASLTHRLLAFSRNQPLNPVAVDVNKLLSDMSDLMTRTFGKDIAIRFALAPDIPGTWADAHQLESAVLNLALNARDAMPDGGKLTVASTVVELDEAQAAQEAEAAGKYIEISVSDTGQGIAESDVEHVVEPFYTTKEVGQGSGLGLSMVFGFIKQSGGHLHITSQLGEGTRVALYLPIISGAAATARDSDTTAAEARGAGQIILVVEDDSDLRHFVEQALGELGYRVCSAADAAEALNLLEENPGVELLFSDIVLPGGV
ncbi:MAG: PAS domain S-box protein, partial [Rhodospirillaceae bacterium]|nr:PAS domain S-box protein [Rhodospirillaceae bacterium]